jgi:hypothetical protein
MVSGFEDLIFLDGFACWPSSPPIFIPFENLINLLNYLEKNLISFKINISQK